MKYCEKCGCELEDNTIICEKCGNQIMPKQTVTLQQPVQSNGISILSFVLSIIGFMTAGFGFGILFDIVAIVLAIIALKKAKINPIKKGLPTAGLIIAALSLILMILIYGSAIVVALSKVK